MTLRELINKVGGDFDVPICRVTADGKRCVSVEVACLVDLKAPPVTDDCARIIVID
jgi:hypothetical protein